jgi:hypothetical protein
MALMAPSSAGAETEWQIRPFAALTFGGGTTLLDLDFASGKLKTAIGVSAGLLGDVLGFDVDLSHSPGFFTGDTKNIAQSSVTTFTGNVIVGAPRSATEFTLRPYFVGGFGVMRAHSYPSSSGALEVNMTRPAVGIGGGVSGSLTDRTGLSWELRHFRSVGEVDPRGQSVGPESAGEKLSFWRANMALVIRY